jgi:hypothetical protein
LNTEQEEESAEQSEYLASFGWNKRRLDLTTTKNALFVILNHNDAENEKTKTHTPDEEQGIEMMDNRSKVTPSLSHSDSTCASPTQHSPLHTLSSECDHEAFPNVHSTELVEAGRYTSTIQEIIRSPRIQFLLLFICSTAFSLCISMKHFLYGA